MLPVMTRDSGLRGRDAVTTHHDRRHGLDLQRHDPVTASVTAGSPRYAPCPDPAFPQVDPARNPAWTLPRPGRVGAGPGPFRQGRGQGRPAARQGRGRVAAGWFAPVCTPDRGWTRLDNLQVEVGQRLDIPAVTSDRVGQMIKDLSAAVQPLSGQISGQLGAAVQPLSGWTWAGLPRTVPRTDDLPAWTPSGRRPPGVRAVVHPLWAVCPPVAGWSTRERTRSTDHPGMINDRGTDRGKPSAIHAAQPCSGPHLRRSVPAQPPAQGLLSLCSEQALSSSLSGSDLRFPSLSSA